MIRSTRSGRRRAALALGATVLALGGCATRLQPPITGYLCCNLPVQSDIIYASNVLGGPVARLGLPVRVEQTKRHAYFWGYVGNTYMGFTDDVTPGSRSATGSREWLGRIVVSQDPAARLATWSTDVQRAVRSGRVRQGMTREQVAMALGYPSAELTPEPATAPSWAYYTMQDEQPVTLRFDTQGRLERVDGSEDAKALVDPGL
ncbi:outer membrane protein assembly factor BamE domain-containing protein [Pseudacidovorax sp. NFM-22]|uniref:outer membrane protein assembly factor BamE domain-containing protein n=1 Tax=Pseudacidovorax sp. NFM-22 TaxID=2744469 RepID=UPI001F3F2A69|nr:outer membrane protein assembly factor BamE [Pseudacidovorax sp. NFM-22]